MCRTPPGPTPSARPNSSRSGRTRTVAAHK
jgi:hypothetical protein